MAFTASYTIQQSANSTSLTVTDTSSYSSEAKSTFSSRRLYLVKSDGTYVKFPSNGTSDYIDFSFVNYPSDQITITGFQKDLSLSIKLELVSTSPVGGSVYTSTNIVTMLGFTNAAIYNSGQILATNPTRINDKLFLENLRDLQREKVTAANAGTYNDQFSSQAALDRAYYIIQYKNIRF